MVVVMPARHLDLGELSALEDRDWSRVALKRCTVPGARVDHFLVILIEPFSRRVFALSAMRCDTLSDPADHRRIDGATRHDCLAF